MTTLTRVTPASEWDEAKILEFFINHHEAVKQKHLFEKLLGQPVWWLAEREKTEGRPRFKAHSRNAIIWPDPRLAELGCQKAVLRSLAKKRKPLEAPFVLNCAHHEAHYCIPLVVEDELIGFVVLSHLKYRTNGISALEFLHSGIRMMLERARKEFDLSRLSESIRPRAIALSTVHTVHRIINSTLNLSELLKRLTHLTAQVLRAETCSIFLNDSSQKSRTLVERAKAGFSKKKSVTMRAFRPGEGLEGRVFKTAKHVMRKKAISIPLIDEDVIGVMTLTQKKDGRVFDSFDLEILTTLAEEAVIAIKNAQLYEEQRRVTLSTIQSLANILGAKLHYATKLDAHCLLEMVIGVAQELGMNEEDKQALHHAALLKDAGKIGLPDEILKKPEKLTGQEYQLIRQHPIKGAMIIRSFESLKPVVPIILHCHEHFDGSGYPHGLKGHEIPLGARILGVTNAFEALISGRPYRSKVSLSEALAELERNSGSQFDPKVLEAFVKVVHSPQIARHISNLG